LTDKDGGGVKGRGRIRRGLRLGERFFGYAYLIDMLAAFMEDFVRLSKLPREGGRATDRVPTKLYSSESIVMSCVAKAKPLKVR
jgi:hypothetical protein